MWNGAALSARRKFSKCHVRGMNGGLTSPSSAGERSAVNTIQANGITMTRETAASRSHSTARRTCRCRFCERPRRGAEGISWTVLSAMFPGTGTSRFSVAIGAPHKPARDVCHEDQDDKQHHGHGGGVAHTVLLEGRDVDLVRDHGLSLIHISEPTR